MTIKHCFIFDIEKTLANDCDRQHLIPKDPKCHEDWGLYQDQFKHDQILFGPMTVARSLQVLGSEVIISTGLPMQLHMVINDWLLKHGLICKHIFMRTIDDQQCMTSSVDLKQAHLDIIREHLCYKVAGAFDDREDICQMYRDNGILTFKIN